MTSFSFDITAHGDEVWMDASVVDDDLARQILDEYYHLPDNVTDGSALFERFTQQGLQIMIRDQGELRRCRVAWSGDDLLTARGGWHQLG